ncbi:MAG TPA: hypothetical protein VNL14_10395 [Candidatus Acidoferrales bacterium]|nr:hypothetical protein [Candidatus Acidoferrales bacterium]
MNSFFLRYVVRLAVLAILYASVAGCAAQPFQLQTVADERIEDFVKREARQILLVSEKARLAASYRFYLARFRRDDILGLSIGGGEIFISYRLARLAYGSEYHRWLLRQTLAHEIAHDVLGPAQRYERPQPQSATGLANSITGRELGLIGSGSFRAYSQASELEADRKGMAYWRALGWDCRVWIAILRGFAEQGYLGDVDHPTHARLYQAVEICDKSSVSPGSN